MVAPIENLKIDSMVVPLNSLSVEFERSPKEFKSRRDGDRQTRIVLPDGRRMHVSDRFWSSFSSLHNLGRSVFAFFSHGEVFERITQNTGNHVRVALETQGDGGRMLSCTNPTKPLLQLDEVRELVNQYDGTSTSYAEGIVTATFECPFPANFAIGGDDFRTQFNLQMPVDGYGLPSAFLGLLRLVCTNGLVAMSPAFKTGFQLGKDSPSLIRLLHRAMDTFNNEEGFHALRQRVESSTSSWASLNEAKRLHATLAASAASDGMKLEQRAEILGGLNKACGDPLGIYGLSGHEEVSVRRAKSIPVEATVYDLMNFATEVSTHRLMGQPARSRINAFIGDMLTQEYDLEGTVTQFPDFADYFVARNAEAHPVSSAIASSNN